VIRTRFAPSPTGSLHVGNARIAVLGWLFTRKHGGTFILRIEDTDIDRNVAGAEQGIYDDLTWLGLDWDEGPDKGEHGPYRQSERSDSYLRCAHRLLQDAHAYYCFCPPDSVESDSVEAERGTPGAQRPPRCACAHLADADAQRRSAAGEAAAIRFRVPASDAVEFDDVVRGTVRVPRGDLYDFVLLRSDGRPTYNFAVVVDDIEMHITHVIRGVGHLSNTPRQVLLYDAFGAVRPIFAHVPMVLGPDRQKLSKRHGATAMAEYRTQGYHADALVNYLSLLSWSSPSGEDVLTREQLVQEVSLERIGAADVVFDPVKLRWVSSKHIEKMPLEALVEAVRPFIDPGRFTLDAARLRVAVAATRSHLATFADINAQLELFYPSSPQAAAVDGEQVLATAARVLHETDEWTEPALTAALQRVGKESGARGRALYEPLRRALTGREHGPPLAAVLFVQGREAVLRQLDSTIDVSSR
jgi:nondiscriminating glutamyl-tRNA synthetase